MKSENAKENQEKLNRIIFELAKAILNDDGIKSYSLSLQDIYVGDFRHSYSDFFPIIVKIFRENEYDKDYLLTNLGAIKNFVESDFEKTKTIFKEEELNGIRKLCDHINLEVSRLNYNVFTNEDLKDAKDLLNLTKQELDSTKADVQKATEDLKNSHGHIVAVLSIFAAVVLAFAGGLGILGNSISSVVNAPILKLLLVIFATGLVLIDSLTALIYAASRIVGKSIFAKCKNEECNCKKDNGKPLCSGLTKIRKRLPFIFWINVILVILIGVTIVLYGFNLKYCFIK